MSSFAQDLQAKRDLRVVASVARLQGRQPLVLWPPRVCQVAQLTQEAFQEARRRRLFKSQHQQIVLQMTSTAEIGSLGHLF